MPRSLPRILASIALTLVLTFAGNQASAQEYPARPVKIIVPFAAGGPADLIRPAKASPGKLNYATSGPGTPYHMAG